LAAEADCCYSYLISDVPNGEENKDGTFTKINAVHDGYPVYQNEDGQYLYYWQPFQDWKVGSDYKVVTGTVQSEKDQVGCPETFNSWFHLNNANWVSTPMSVSCKAQQAPVVVPIPAPTDQENCCTGYFIDNVPVVGAQNTMVKDGNGVFTQEKDPNDAEKPLMHDNHPVYKNDDDQYLYYWRPYQDWRVGPDYKVATAGIHSHNNQEGCPDTFNSWQYMDMDEAKWKEAPIRVSCEACDWDTYEWIVDNQVNGAKLGSWAKDYGWFVQTQATILVSGALAAIPAIGFFVFSPFFGADAAKLGNIFLDITDIGDFYGTFLEDDLLLDYWGWGTEGRPLGNILFGSDFDGRGTFTQPGSNYTLTLKDDERYDGNTWMSCYIVWIVAALYATTVPLFTVYKYFYHVADTHLQAAQKAKRVGCGALYANDKMYDLFSIILLEIPLFVMRLWIWSKFNIPISIFALKNLSQIVKEGCEVILAMNLMKEDSCGYRCVSKVANMTKVFDYMAGTASVEDADESGSGSD
jgi:hypothetical protein